MDWLGTLWGLLKGVFLFALVLGLAYLSTRLVASRFGMQARGRHLRVLEQVVIGRDRSLLLVEIAGQIHLLGSTAESIRLLSTISDPELVEAMLLTEPPASADLRALPNPFSKMPGSFRSILGRFQREPVHDDVAAPPQDAAESKIREQIDRLRRLTKQ